DFKEQLSLLNVTPFGIGAFQQYAVHAGSDLDVPITFRLADVGPGDGERFLRYPDHRDPWNGFLMAGLSVAAGSEPQGQNADEAQVDEEPYCRSRSGFAPLSGRLVKSVIHLWLLPIHDLVPAPSSCWGMTSLLTRTAC